MTVSAAIVLARIVGGTRADLVVRMPGVTLLIEAKVYADEQPGQCDRLADAWTEEEPELVFLTLDGRLSYTAVRSAGLWHRLAWPQVAAVIADAARASGVLEEAFSRAVGIVSQHPETAARRLWIKSGASGWVWWNYLPLEASETDLDAYAVRHVEGIGQISKKICWPSR